MRILCNLPLECFDDRAAMRGVELVTFGPAERMLVDGVHFPYDVEFDPSRGSWQQLAERLPPGFEPDVLLLYWPDQEPLPDQLESCPWQIVGVVSDYNLSLPYLVGLWPFFDVLLCDRAGEELFTRLTFGDVRYWCQYSHKPASHRPWPDAGPRDLDVGFVGNLNPVVQRERAPWLARLQGLGNYGVDVHVRSDVSGADYGRFLNRCRIGWNRSIRGEMNLRAFEVPACGALLLQERSNLEIADFFVPGEECVLYGDDDFEHVVLELLGDEPRRQRIAAAGQRRLHEHRFANRVTQLAEMLSRRGPGRPASTAADRTLGRGVAMLTSWAGSDAVAMAALAAQRAAPDDPKALNLLALATLRLRGSAGGDTAWRLWQRAAAASPSYLPAITNLAALAAASADDHLKSGMHNELERRRANPDWSDLDGPTLPLGYAAAAVERSLALQAAVRTGDPRVFATALAV